MPKKKTPIKLLAVAEVASATPIVERIKAKKTRLAKLKAATVKDGKHNKYEPKYRETLKSLKRAQRRLKKEVIRVSPKHPPKAVAAPAAAPAPAEAPKAAEEKKE